MLKVAVVGCGLISTAKYIPILLKSRAKATIVGLCDVNTKTLTEAATAFGISNRYASISELLERQRPDVVIVATPPATHTRLVVEALEKGAHVLVEKPMALAVADCDRMVETARRHDRKLGVMHNQVFNPAFERARAIAQSGKLGTVLGMRVFLMTSVHDMTQDPAHWAHRLPAGAVSETAPHAVYLSLALLEHVKEIDVRSKKHLPEYAWAGPEDIRIDLIADNGISSIMLMYGSNQTAGEVDIIGTTGMLRVDLQTRIVVSHNRPAYDQTISTQSIGGSLISNMYQTASGAVVNAARHILWERMDGHNVGVRQFLDHVAHDTEYPASGQKGKDVVVLMERIVHKLQNTVGGKVQGVEYSREPQPAEPLILGPKD